ncbi:MAG: hypothetical protein K9W44_10765 [Candidatus Lokiarchaeota archaeon]|nr:hypothetical protein [Candidatus Harpocratesius repetitus]
MDFSETIVSNKKPFKADIINMVPEEELVITGTGKWNSRIKFIVDDPKTFDEIYSSGWNSAYDEASCAAADIDGDGIDEIILATQDDSEQMRLLVYDDAKHDYERISLQFIRVTVLIAGSKLILDILMMTAMKM